MNKNKHNDKILKMSLLFNKNVLLASKMRCDKVALYSFTNQQITEDICNKILTLPGITTDSIITDATSSVGGMILPLLKKFNNINAVEINKNRFKMLCNNINEYIKYSNISPNITLYCANWLNINKYLQNDIVLIDAPWMTPEMVQKKIWYKDVDKLHLYLIGNNTHNNNNNINSNKNKNNINSNKNKYNNVIIDIEDIVVDIANTLKYLILKVPYNFDFDSFNNKINNIYEIITIDTYKSANSKYSMYIIYLHSII